MLLLHGLRLAIDPVDSTTSNPDNGQNTPKAPVDAIAHKMMIVGPFFGQHVVHGSPVIYRVLVM